ncbi:MAG: M10 family metallopeptidase [Pseudomonadota bacterium]
MSVQNSGSKPVAYNSAQPGDFSLDPYGGLGYTYGGKPILALNGANSVTTHLDTGRSVHSSSGVITYSFNQLPHATGLFNNPNYGLSGSSDYSAFSPEQQDAARAAIQLWDDLIPQTFKESNGRGADIIFANSSDPAQAFAYYPVNGKGYTYQSDVFVADPALNPSNTLFNYGQYGNTTLIHELGHSLGESHPGAYNGTGTFATDAEYAQDTYQYSIMSYFNGTNSRQLAINWDLGGVVPGSISYSSGGAVTGFSFRANYPEAPQLHDIYVIQQSYGADPTTRTGATTYGFNSNAGNELYDFNANPNPMYSIYDAGGNDTIDASGFNVGQFIDLHAGAFSSIGGGAPSAADVNAYWTEYYAAYGLQFPAGYFTDAFLAQAQSAVQSIVSGRIAADTGVTGINATQFDNVSIAYGVVIENAIGGSARDLLVGNEVANVLKGLGGDDVLKGNEGNDTLIGGTGNDTLVGGTGSDLFVFANDGSLDTIGDFATGADKIDLSGVAGVTASNVSYNTTTHQVQIDTDHNGIADMFINSAGVVNSGDYIFA